MKQHLPGVWISFILLSYQGIVAQESLTLIRLIQSKYFGQEVVNGKIEVQSVRPDEVYRYTKWVYADNRHSTIRIIQIPEKHQTLYYDGQSTHMFFDTDKEYYKVTDSNAVSLFAKELDNISTLLLTRQSGQAEGAVQKLENFKESFHASGPDQVQYTIEMDDIPEYYITDNKLIMEFNTAKPELELTQMTYAVMGEGYIDEHRLDTVYQDRLEIDGIMADIRHKMDTYALRSFDIEEEEEETLSFTLDTILAHLVFLTDPPPKSTYFLLDFYYTRCPPCLKAIPSIKTIRAAYPDSTLAVIAVNPYDARDKIETFMQMSGMTYASAMLDKSVLDRMTGVMPFPTFVLFDGKGNIIWQTNGYSDDLVDEIRQHIKP